MAELMNKKIDKRILFPKGEQQAFLRRVKNILGISNEKLASILSIVPRSLSDWLREKNTMPLSALTKLCKLTSLPIPKNISYRDKYWYVKIGAPLGAKARYEKYGSMILGDQEYRKKKWREWWNKEGKSKNKIIGISKNLAIPEFSQNLAEFTGILLGDGGITKYQVKITLNSKTDKEYAVYVCSLIKNLFEVTPAIMYDKYSKAMNICISRIKLVDYAVRILGLINGNKLKEGIMIPKWILKNVDYQKACVKGMIDTDGCIFYEKHVIKNKIYSYPRLNFVSASSDLVTSVCDILADFDLNPKIRRNGYAVQIENKEKICQYLKVIGTSNPKHWRRWNENLTIIRKSVRVV